MDSGSVAHSPAHDAMVALTAVGTFQTYLQHADAKVSVLSAVLAGSAGAMLSTGGASTIPAVLYLAAFLGAGLHLAQALRPRLDGDPTTSAFGIMGITRTLPPDAAAQRDEAWAMARILARVAERKHRHVIRAIPWTTASAFLAVTHLAWTISG
ncbi:hypothetical protein [Actinomadura harenae]|uniref:hypothetical protein n=1 Tax=Actinomadura harenae TaxID=2483351 RepID=UPI00131530A0|nr:hypothetical protein [Actinomadura harenae]